MDQQQYTTQEINGIINAFGNGYCEGYKRGARKTLIGTILGAGIAGLAIVACERFKNKEGSKETESK